MRSPPYDFKVPNGRYFRRDAFRYRDKLVKSSGMVEPDTIKPAKPAERGNENIRNSGARRILARNRKSHII
jgi:hypothetical protein